MNNEQQKLEIMIKLPRGLSLPGGLVGAVAKTKLCDKDTSIYTPSFRKIRRRDEFKPIVPVKTAANWEQHFNSPPHDTRAPWGRVTSHQEGEGGRGIHSFYVTRLIAITDESVTHNTAQKIYHSLDDWAQLLCDWYEVYFQTTRGNSLEVKQHSKHHEGVQVDSNGKIDSELKCKHPIAITLEVGDKPNIRPQDWRRILELTGMESAPPEPHILLRDSRIEYGRKNYRRCVLDAATAAEMALIKLQDSTLLNTDLKIAKSVRKKYRGIYELVEYLKTTEVEFPKDQINNDVAKPRNKAIHEGVMPSKEQAVACLEKATELVNRAFPIN